MQKFRASRRQRASFMRETFKLDDTSNKDLHFLVGSETVSCHQSMMIPYSKFMRSLLRDRISRAGVPDITIILPDVKMTTVKSLLEYIYTGKTNINKIKEVNEIDSLRRLLQMKIGIDKKIYPLDKQKNNHNPRSNEKKPALPEAKSQKSDRKTDPLPPVEKSPVKESPVGLKVKSPEAAPVAPAAQAVIKKEKSLNNSSEEENVQKDPYSLSVQPLKLRVKIETPPEPEQTAVERTDLQGGSSMFQRILKSISGDQEETEGPHETVREEMLRAVEEESEESGSDSSDSSSEDSDSEEDSVPQLPVEGEDGVPSINTSLLMLELSKDEERLHKAIRDFMVSPGLEPGTCAECGHQLTVDNFVLHHSIHLEDVKQAKLKLLYSPHKRSEDDEEEVAEARMEWSCDSQPPTTKQEQKEEEEEEVEPAAPASLPPTPPPEKETVEQEIDKLQQDQRRISQGITSFMEKMQRGTKQMDCSECEASLTIVNLVQHFQKHIQDLHEQIESLVKKKSENKRKLEPRKETPRKKMKESRPTPAKTKAISTEENKERLGSEEERKKMYKRIYGRKKYQYKINRRAEDVKVTEEEIDAEIAKEKAKYSGQPMLAGGDPVETANMSAGELLRNFVQFGSKEYKHEFKKARDRLYKRKLRVLRMKGIMDNTAALDIPRSDIEVEMLSRYSTSRNVKTDDKPDGETVQEAPEEHKNVLEDDLELSLDVDDFGELFKGAETIMGDTSMATLVSEITDENKMQSILTDIVVKTTLEEGVQSQIIL